MTAATKDVANTFRAGPFLAYGLQASIKTYRAMMLGLNTSNNVRGFVIGDVFAGHQLDPMIDNSNGAAGDEIAYQVLSGRYLMEVTLSGVTGTHARNRVPVFAVDASTYSLRVGQMVGRVVQYVDVDTAIVEFDTTATRQCLSETVTKSDFTDGGSTSGYKDFVNSLPEGAKVIDVVYDVRTGFTGDTSAAATVGESGNVDRFTVGSSSVLAADVVGMVAPATSADNCYLAAAVTPRVTVTGAADFTNIASGATMDVKIFYEIPWRI